MKEKLNKCVTWADSQKVWEDSPKHMVQDFVNALKKAKEFVDLTMRDEFLLTQAEPYLSCHKQ
jgi:hypothetical protein